MAGYTVITTMKNEGAFLLEWVAHHKALGFDNILICTNDCADHTRRMALRLQEMGLARHHDTQVWSATSIQRSALKQATRYAEVREADWIYVCDADEFLVVKFGDGSARALVAAASVGVEVIPVAWRVFGPNGQREYQPGPVTRQFTHARRTLPAHVVTPAYPKSLFRGLENMHRIGVHAPVPRPDLGRELMAEMPGAQPMVPQHHKIFVQADYRFAQVNHYVLRSRDSFLVKRERGRVNHTLQSMDMDYWDRFDVAQERCDAIRRYDADVAHWLGVLMGDAPLAHLHRRAVVWHKARIAALHADPAWAEVIAATEERLMRCVSLAS
ncbi:MAG: glycosyltransferase family 2 protein [Paracoccaceae bacterium]